MQGAYKEMGSGQQGMADVCLVLEGTYPYVMGGVSAWTHKLISACSELSFHLVSLLPDRKDRQMRFRLPENVTGITHVYIHEFQQGEARMKDAESLLEKLSFPLVRLMSDGGLKELESIIRIIAPHKSSIGRRLIFDSRQSWNMLLRTYLETHPESSFPDYFWTWRTLLGGLYSVLFAELPRARLYHAVSTGFAGLFIARARLETGRPVILTEHGIYTNERRIEIASADWVFEKESGFNLKQSGQGLKDLWIKTFISYSKACYQASEKIITLFEGNQQFQIEDGAPLEKLEVIPNGIDFENYAKVQKKKRGKRRTIALIGRVVAIKDIKTFIRASSLVKKVFPDIQAFVIGPVDESTEYYKECIDMVNHLALGEMIQFTGHVNIEDYLPDIDLLVLTSISEAMPLVVLESGAAGIPIVTTDVGACRELVYGRTDENPRLGNGGIITELANPVSTAGAVIELLTDTSRYNECSRVIRERVRLYYDKKVIDMKYKELYRYYGQMPDGRTDTCLEV